MSDFASLSSGFFRFICKIISIILRSMPPHLTLFANRLAGWMNRPQQMAIDSLMEENKVIKELHGDKRLTFTNEQRKRLARKGSVILNVFRGLLDGIDGELLRKRYLIMDRDPLFTKALRRLLKSCGVNRVRYHPGEPLMNI
jgi:hypothetical protein